MGVIDGCKDKVVFFHRSHAVIAAKRIKGREAYQCPHCGRWHVGSTRWTKKKRTKKGADR